MQSKEIRSALTRIARLRIRYIRIRRFFPRRILFTVIVRGESCWPDLIPGARYYATAIIRPRLGDFVVFENPRGPGACVKKFSSKKNGQFNLTSTVSWGSAYSIDCTRILGVVLPIRWVRRLLTTPFSTGRQALEYVRFCPWRVFPKMPCIQGTPRPLSSSAPESAISFCAPR